MPVRFVLGRYRHAKSEKQYIARWVGRIFNEPRAREELVCEKAFFSEGVGAVAKIFVIPRKDGFHSARIELHNLEDGRLVVDALREELGIELTRRTEFVVYQAQYDSKEFGLKAFWFRPRAMFSDRVDLPSRRTTRFEHIAD